jgi:hypothetical protein
MVKFLKRFAFSKRNLLLGGDQVNAMRIQHGKEHLTVGSLAQIDALIGELVMDERPVVHWEDSYARFRFESLDEALDAMRDPVIQGFIPSEQRSSTVLEEVREFRPYSSALLAAWEVVERMQAQPLRLVRERDDWIAAFGDGPEVRATSAALAICLAALGAKGVKVSLSTALRP